MDGNRCVARVLSELPSGDRLIAARVLGALAATGAIDISGRPIGRFLHSATKKGVMPAGGLEGDEVLQLVMDGDDGACPGPSRIGLSREVPQRLGPLHALTRSRRSRRGLESRRSTRRRCGKQNRANAWPTTALPPHRETAAAAR